MTFSILIVDDDTAVKATIQEFLERTEVNVVSASSAKEALDLLNAYTPDLVLTDIIMKGMDGLDLTRFIQKNHGVPVIVMTGYTADYSYKEAVNAGASDFIFKPFRLEELDLRIKRVMREVQLKKENVKMVNRLEELAITDGLTSLYNSRHFFSQLKAEIERYTRYHHPLSLLILDIDRFKKFNDTWGHLEGDKVLMAMGEIITSCLRSNDTGYRYGGEEFAVILPETRVEEACLAGERIRSILAQRSFTPDNKTTVKVTISLGATQLSIKETLESFVKRADMAMYKSKKAGRDQLTCLPFPGEEIC